MIHIFMSDSSYVFIFSRKDPDFGDMENHISRYLTHNL